MLRRPLVALVAALAVLAGCSDDATPTDGQAADATAMVDESSATNASGGTDGPDGPGGPQGTGVAGTDESGSSGITPGGTLGSTPTTGTQATGGTSPSTTLEPVMPPPPVVGCIDAAAGPAIVELSFDDDTMRYAGAVAPPCVRIHAAQRLRVTNAANFASSGSIGAQTFQLAEGGSTTTAALGSTRSVGDVFDVRVTVLSATVTVQVLP